MSDGWKLRPEFEGRSCAVRRPGAAFLPPGVVEVTQEELDGILRGDYPNRLLMRDDAPDPEAKP